MTYVKCTSAFSVPVIGDKSCNIGKNAVLEDGLQQYTHLAHVILFTLYGLQH